MKYPPIVITLGDQTYKVRTLPQDRVSFYELMRQGALNKALHQVPLLAASTFLAPEDAVHRTDAVHRVRDSVRDVGRHRLGWRAWRTGFTAGLSWGRFDECLDAVDERLEYRVSPPAESIRQRLTHQEQRGTWFDDVGREIRMRRLPEAKVDPVDWGVTDQVLDRQVEGSRPRRESVEAAVPRGRIQVIDAAVLQARQGCAWSAGTDQDVDQEQTATGETLDLGPIDGERNRSAPWAQSGGLSRPVDDADEVVYVVRRVETAKLQLAPVENSEQPRLPPQIIPPLRAEPGVILLHRLGQRDRVAVANPSDRVEDEPTLEESRLADMMPEEALGRDARHGNDVATRESLVECGKESIMENGVGREQG